MVASLQAGEHPVSWPGMRTAQTRQPVPPCLRSMTQNHGDEQPISRTREMRRDRKEQLSQLTGGLKTGGDPSPGIEGKSWIFRHLN